MLSGLYSPGEVHFYHGLGKGAFAARTVIEENRNESAMMACTNAADCDADGDLDLFIGDEAGDITFFRGREDGAYEAGISIFTGLTHAQPKYTEVRDSLGEDPVIPGYRLRLAVADWNRDGALDLLIGNCEPTEAGTIGHVRVLLRKQLL